LSLHLVSEIFPLADHAHPHPVAVQIGQVMANKTAQQPHQLADFRRRSRPVLGAEGEDGEKFDAQIAGRPHRTPQRLDPAAMPLPARQAARRRPPPIAIHDDGNVAWHGESAELGSVQRLAFRHSPQLKP